MKDQIRLKDIIIDLPKIRSGINRRIVNDPDTDTNINKKIYEKINDTDENWLGVVENYQTKLF